MRPLLNTTVSSQSTTAFGGTADRGNDRNTDGNYWNGSVTHTDHQDRPWWQVITRPGFVDSISIFNRTDCCMDRLGTWSVWVESEQGVWTRLGPLGSSATIGQFELRAPLDNSWGRVRSVVVQKDGSGWLSLAEVQVWERR
jgi:hypothetical protein